MGDRLTTVLVLLYGDYLSLHVKMLNALLGRLPLERVELRLWLNVTSIDTLRYLTDRNLPNAVIYICDSNMPKYRTMRYMFNDPRYPITTPWITWFDDDSIVKADDWYEQTLDFVVKNPTVQFFGRQGWKQHFSGVGKFIRQAVWFTHRPFQKVRGNINGTHFILGAYWWLRVDAMRQLDWPDPRLSHNGGDTLLSEAVWQQGMNQLDFSYGVDVNTIGRRGRSDKPAGYGRHRKTKTDARVPKMLKNMRTYHLELRKRNIGWISCGEDLITCSRELEPLPVGNFSIDEIVKPRKKPIVRPVKSKKPGRSRTLREMLAARRRGR